MFNLIAIPAFVIAPAGLLLYYFWIRDRWEKEPWSVIWVLFGLGCMSVVPAAAIELALLGTTMKMETIGQVFFAAFLGVALVEEAVKFIVVYFFTFKSKYFREEYDGIIYAVAVGLGFAFLENILYVGMALAEGPEALVVAIARAFTAVPSHALDGVIVGYFLGRSRFLRDPAERFKLNLKGVGLAVLFHGLYDLFVFLMMVIPESVHGWCVVGLIWTLVVQWGTAHRLIRNAQERSKLRWIEAAGPVKLPIIEPQQAVRRFCRYCGSQLQASDDFCTQCGARLG